MIIGIKYCGGCNSRFNRGKFVEILMGKYNNVTFEPAKENFRYDMVLVICGCFSECANHASLIGRKKLIINSEHELCKVSKVINEMYYE